MVLLSVVWCNWAAGKGSQAGCAHASGCRCLRAVCASGRLDAFLPCSAEGGFAVGKGKSRCRPGDGEPQQIAEQDYLTFGGDAGVADNSGQEGNRDLGAGPLVRVGGNISGQSSVNDL